MARCAGIKRDGNRCEVVVNTSRTYCYQHDPANADRRKRAASKGGRSKPNRELADIKTRLSGLIDAVLEGSQDKGRAAVAIQGFNSLKGVLELERKVRETDELEARLEALESLQGPRKGGSQWGT